MNWKFVRGEKKPFQTNGRLASHSDPSTWSSLERAFAASSRVGYVFSADDPFCGVDLDNCIDTNGNVHPAAQAIIDALGSYTEVSPSGRGVHIIIEAYYGGGRQFKDTEWGGKLEIYDRERYFTFAGKPLNGRVIKRGVPPRPLDSPTAGAGARAGDWLTEARKNEKFRTLYDEGDASGYGDDHSSADMALMDLLAYYIGAEYPRTIIHAFMASALYRGRDKSGGDDYVLRTLESALRSTTVPQRRRVVWRCIPSLMRSRGRMSQSTGSCQSS